ncbi:MAG: homoserine dehydrogenase [Candidatus Marinimicrobia bacterium]|nr:homoserine dehydrogenase [Candidatus Neomarinimicrobiota bacterium]MCF7903564.1 homoserine dehydrogenase [Candidatus Neomarinimicrobiota bacterium]
MAKVHRIILLGFGTVAKGLCQIISDKHAELMRSHHVDLRIVTVVTRSRGAMNNPDGIPIAELLQLTEHSRPFSAHVVDWDTETAILNSTADTVVELTHTNIDTGQPALSYCRAALNAGKHLVCGNKGPATVAYTELSRLAQENNTRFLNEATVLSGTPVLSLVRTVLAGNQITRIRGILNGATNFILTEMEAGSSSEAALSEAEARGYLEADHSADIDGLDAQAKLVILANELMGLSLKPGDVKRSGIADIRAVDIRTAADEDMRWKLIGSIELTEQGAHAEVKPEKVSMNDPLAHVMGTTNSITLSTDLLGDVTISGPGAGSVETGYGVLSDLLTIISEV